MSTQLKSVDQIIAKWDYRKDFLVEILQDIQDEHRYLPMDALKEVANILKVPLNHIYEVSTFYKAFSLEPKGKHCVNVCLGTACHVQGAMLLLGALEREMGIKMGETDRDMEFTLDAVRCIGCCGLAPVVTVNADVHGKLSADRVPQVLQRYKKLSKS